MWWYGAMTVAGLAFGLVAERRPFGEDVLTSPLVVFAAAAGAALLVLRFVSGQPVPEVIGARALAVGVVAGLAALLLGNWLGTVVLRIG
jgi:hypothetical protein